jgi:hypothetical protein
MPVVSTNSPKNNVTPVFGADNPGRTYVFAPDDTFASIQVAPNEPTPLTPTIALPANALIQLPGPFMPSTSTVQNETDLPSNGDYYRIADPYGRVGVGGQGVTVDGGGFPIFGEPSILLDFAFVEAEFTFDATAKAWIACVCNEGVD